ncbi:MAG: helix-turn-helix domain-containing protein [Allobaculum sp.]|nr:helix-turn-helix domain-containing protein [Allobaculum sp.]
MMRKKTVETIPVLSQNMKEILTSIVNTPTLPSGIAKRAKIVLLSSQGILNRDIGPEVGLHPIRVGIWRNRFLESLPHLREVEETSGDLQEEIIFLLADRPGPGKPSRFTPEQIEQIINLACQDPAKYGYEATYWTSALLAQEIPKQGIADKISSATVRVFLHQADRDIPYWPYPRKS